MDRDTAHARIREAVADGAGSLQQVADRLGVRPQTVHGHLANMHDGADVRADIVENRRQRADLHAAYGRAKTLTEAAEFVRSLPHVHRNTAADAPERAAVQVRNRLMREAARRASVAEIARVVGLTHGWAWECVHAGRGRNPGTA